MVKKLLLTAGLVMALGQSIWANCEDATAVAETKIKALLKSHKEISYNMQRDYGILLWNFDAKDVSWQFKHLCSMKTTYIKMHAKVQPQKEFPQVFLSTFQGEVRIDENPPMSVGIEIEEDPDYWTLTFDANEIFALKTAKNITVRTLSQTDKTITFKIKMPDKSDKVWEAINVLKRAYR